MANSEGRQVNREREKPINIRMSMEEFEAIEKKAKEWGMTASTFIRLCGIHAELNIDKLSKLGSSELRNKTLMVKVLEDEYKTIDSNANKFNLTISAYLRLVALKAYIKVVIEE